MTHLYSFSLSEGHWEESHRHAQIYILMTISLVTHTTLLILQNMKICEHQNLKKHVPSRHHSCTSRWMTVIKRTLT